MSGGGSPSIQMRPRKPAVGTSTDRIGEFFWRHSTDQADLERVNEVLCGSYDGVLIVTFECYADDIQVCDLLYKLKGILWFCYCRRLHQWKLLLPP